MSYILHTPAHPLSEFVECLWFVEDQVTYQREKILPTGTIELILNFGAPFRVLDKDDPAKFTLASRSWICGLQTEYILHEPVAETHMLGIRFKPGGAYPLLHFPIHELSDQMIDMDLIWGTVAEALRDRLFCAGTLSEKFALVEQFLLRRLRFDPYELRAVQSGVGSIIQLAESPSIKDLSEALGMSQKHLNHQFKKIVGVSPKVLARIFKFQHALHRVNAGQNMNWAMVAQDCHYYDQSHFNRDFAAFAGFSPSTYIHLRERFLGVNLQAEDGVHFVPVG